jgi:ATP-dependent protease ClpP protease subunit
VGLRFEPTDDPAVVELRIGTGDCYAVNGPAQEQFRQFRTAIAALSPGVNEINVRINLDGGHSNIAIGLHDLLRGWRGRVITSVEQVAWSSGAVLAQAGSVRRMAADGLFGMHHANLTIDLSVVPGGRLVCPAADLRRYADMVDQADEQCIRIFAERTGGSCVGPGRRDYGAGRAPARLARAHGGEGQGGIRANGRGDRTAGAFSVTNDATNPTTSLQWGRRCDR